MSDVLTRIGNMGLIPVVVIDNAELAVPTAKAIIDGGLNVMEITMRTEAGIPAIKNVKEAFPEMLVGAGTVLSVEKAEEAVKAGSEFIVAPGFNPELVSWCIDKGIDITPGCVTPTEVDAALRMGLKVLKFFPANVYGGVSACKALYEPFRAVRFIPTGGVGIDSLSDYVDKPFVHAVGGGWLCKASDISSKNFSAITKAVKDSIAALLGFELAHVGINTEGEAQSLKTAQAFSEAFGFQLKEGNSSNFAGTYIEANKGKGLGQMGHIALRTNSIDRAAYYLEKLGYSVDWSTKKGTPAKTVAVYLKDEICGFAIHLLQK